MTDLNINLSQAGYLITLNILSLGVGNLFWVPLSLKIGKRPVLLWSTAIFLASSIWAAEAKDYASLLGARVVQGFGASSSEALGPAIVADLYFLHERGAMVGFYTFMIAVGSALGGVFGGYVANANSDWRWVFHMDTILVGAVFLFTALFQAETNFTRPQEYETGQGVEASEIQAIRANSRSSWLKSLAVTGWYDKTVSIWWLWWRPFLTLQYPSVIWGSLTYGVTLGWIVLQQTANASALPVLYGYNAVNIGNSYWTYVIGATLGCIAGGPISDYVVALVAKRRKGYFKPEFRLWALIPAYVLGPVGLLMWGFGLGRRLNPMVALVGSGISYGVLCAVPAIGMTYVVDSHRPVSGETMTVLTAFKNTFAFALSFAVTPWIEKDGYAKVGGWKTLIEGVIFATTIPMYIYGERIRRWSVKLTI
ncbi:uncharacterized protein A1O9_09053 [Exophiala aquamarina CBS 119918]|uniref:Major facilitator superfamily (MFS) profile domain-containing protein n=1 Tax=Exophiala aquamarina CBS 119918 TaxID=1182545 RepID=A0A072P429_9EURO|nr:uncharacterized protein A1O9_09053 [Exophiala aquamarina CBS 119918]KEF54611.1 hypothetical protein A1O9_09053 [Exophiala aquamarina CBS 119918]